MASSPEEIRPRPSVEVRSVRIPVGGVVLDGDLSIPTPARGLVLFVHGSGSSRHSDRNRHVAQSLNVAGLATLLFDLLTAEEEPIDRRTAGLRFNIPLLVERLEGATDWALRQDGLRGLRLGYFGASTGGGAALMAAAARPESVAAIVSRGGRPDLAGDALPNVQAPTLLLVGGDDVPVIGMNEEAMKQMTAQVIMEVVPGASHLFEEPGKLEEVARLARDWFERFLAPPRELTS